MRKKLVLLFAILSVFLFVTACSNQQPADPGATPVMTDAPREFDLNGKVIRYKSWYDTTPLERNVSIAGDEKRDVMDNLESTYNFTFEFGKGDEWGTSYTGTYSSTVMAGKCWSEIAIIDNRWFFPDMVCSNLFYPLSDIEAFDFTTDKWAQVATKFGTFRDVVYASELNDFQPRYMIFFNSDLISKANLASPHTYIDNKGWTWDKFKEYCIALTEKDSEGVTTRFGTGGGEGFAQALAFTNDASIIDFTETGKPYFNLNTPNGIEALEFFQDLYVGGQWITTESYKTIEEDFALQKTGMFGGQWYMHGNVTEANAEIKFGFMYLPIGPKGTEYISAASNYNLITMPSTITDVQEVGYIFDLFTNRTPATQSIDSRREAWERSVQEDTSLDVIFSIAKGDIRSESTWITCFDTVNSTLTSALNKIKKQSSTVSAVLESTETSANKKLDGLIKDYPDRFE